jgi:hypothetical protein
VLGSFLLLVSCFPFQWSVILICLFNGISTVSGLSSSRDTAQSQVLTGMGLLAGSTVFLLTLFWGTCVVVGKCDIAPNGVAVDSVHSKGFSLTGAWPSRKLGIKTGSRGYVLPTHHYANPS